VGVPAVVVIVMVIVLMAVIVAHDASSPVSL
jgi:hypothetical protein